MCGLAGIVAWEERYRVTRDLLRRMGQAVAHRGPDGDELWINHEGPILPSRPQCAMAFRRLAILDLDPRAMQPMGEGQRHIVFNGEIYNFRELRDELKGHRWKTTGDTEVLLHAYNTWGDACLDRLNGMFAFAVWEEDAGSLFLARDRMGQKPLYVAVAPDFGAVAFASELAALRLLPWPDWHVDQMSLATYLQCGYVPSPRTIYRGVEKLSPGTFMRCRQGGAPVTKTYFDANQPGKTGDDVRTAVMQAVRRQLVADVPLGVFLSGGIDSSVIAAAAKSALSKGQKLLTFSMGFDDARYDETAFAAAVAKHLGTDHRKFVVRPDAAEDLPKLAAVFGEPFGDSSALPTHYLARETVRHVKVALSGDGGDELFGGYDRYRAMRLGGAVRKISAPLRRAAAALPGSHPKSAATRLKRFAKTLHLPPGRRYASYVALFDEPALAELLPGYSAPNFIAETYDSLSGGRDTVQTALAVDRRTYLPDDLLTKLDHASMLHALEVRSPFMDHELVQLAAGFTTKELLTGGGKRPLREAFAVDLPGEVFTRKKMGFAVPIGQWLRDPLRPMLDDLLNARNSFASAHLAPAFIQRLVDEHQNQRMDHSQRLYALLMLELWWTQQAP